jgi:hypothetical protein
MAKAVKAVKNVVQPVVAETVAEEVAVIEVQPMEVPEVQVPEIVQQAEDVNFQVSEMLTEVGKIDKSVKELEDKIVELRKVKMGWHDSIRVHAHAAEDERRFSSDFTDDEIEGAIEEYKNAFTTAAGFMGQFIIPAIGFDNFKYVPSVGEKKYSNEVVEKLTNLGFINKVSYKSVAPVYAALDSYVAQKTANDANILKMVRDVGHTLGYHGNSSEKTVKNEVRETLAETKFWSVDGKKAVIFRIKKLKDGKLSVSAGGASLNHYINALGIPEGSAEDVAERDRVKALADAWFAEWKQENGIK